MTDTLNIAQVCPGTSALGPGRRFVIWVQGCPFNCAGCVAPDWIPIRTASLVSIHDLAHQITASDDLEGITISGGEPALQSAGLYRLLTVVKAVKPHLSVIAFSGFTLEQLKRKATTDEGVAGFLSHLDVLIDGLYVEGLNDDLGLRGSSNQRVHFLSNRYKAMKDELEAGPRQVEMHLLRSELLMVGVPSGNTLDAFRSVSDRARELIRLNKL